MQNNSKPPATVDDLLKTLDYTFIDIPELVDASEEEEPYVAPEQHMDVAKPLQAIWQLQQPQPQQQQQFQPQFGQQQPQHVQAGASQQYMALPYWQQLQQGARNTPSEPKLGPLGQALVYSMQGTSAETAQALQQQQGQQQQQQQQQQWQQQQLLGSSLSTQPNTGPAQAAAQPVASHANAADQDMDEG